MVNNMNPPPQGSTQKTRIHLAEGFITAGEIAFQRLLFGMSPDVHDYKQISSRPHKPRL